MNAPSLNRVLEVYGLSHRPRGAGQSHDILDETGDELFVGTTSEVWAYVHQFDTISWDDLAAFAEGRLLPAEADVIVVKLHVEGRQRAALRDLFPDVYRRHFEEPAA